MAVASAWLRYIRVNSEGSKTKIVIAAEIPLLRVGFSTVIQGQDEFVLSGQCEVLEDVAALVRQTRPDVLVFDIFSQSANGLELLKSLHGEFPALNILVLTMLDERVYAARAIRAGAMGYITTHQPAAEVFRALGKVRLGRLYLSDEVQTTMLSVALGKRLPGPGSILTTLSDRELEILTLMTQNASAGEIASRLNVSVTTIHTHRHNIKRKINVKTLPELVRQATNLLGGDSLLMQFSPWSRLPNPSMAMPA